MARRKRESKILEVSKKRVAGLMAIEATLDLGSGVSVKTINKSIDDLTDSLTTYNTLLSQADGALNKVVECEKKLRDLSERCLSGVAARYGKDSTEYEKAGGVRKSARKRPERRAPKPT